MMTDNSIPSDDVDKAAKWTVFLLVDLRVLFIITYVYVSVVNLISTTANGEASEDIHSTRLFNITSQPEHANVNVSFIDDAILWNCRDHSDTKHYYRGLYWMLISAFSATMVAFVLTKITIVFGTKHGLLYLWQLAVTEYLQEQLKLDENQEKSKKSEEFNPTSSADNNNIMKDNQNEGKQQSEERQQSLEGDSAAAGYEKCQLGKRPTVTDDSSKKDEVIKKAKKLLSEENPLSKVACSADKNSFYQYNSCRVVNLCLSVLILFIGIVLTFLFYDLHPLSCIHDQKEKYIDYDVTEESVRIRFSTEILQTQKGVGIILPVLALVFVTNAFIFYYCNIHIIKIFTECVKREVIKDSSDSSDGGGSSGGSEKECCHCCRSCVHGCCRHISRLGHCLCFFISE